MTRLESVPEHPEYESRIRACSEVLLCSPRLLRNPPIAEVYDLALEGHWAIQTDTEMPANDLGFLPHQNRVIANYSGQDSGRSAWARRLVQGADQRTRDGYERIAREVTYRMLAQELVQKDVFVGKSERFMMRSSVLVPRSHAKLALDYEVNFVQVNEATSALFDRARRVGPDIRVVVDPDWTPEQTRNALNEPILPDLPRMMMLFDVEHNVAFLLGARYFGEVKKATLTLAWNSVVRSGLGCSLHGSSKLLRADPGGGPRDVTFLTIGLSGSGKSTIGNDAHEGFLRPEAGESVRLGNDDAIAVLFDSPITVGFEDGCFNKTDSYTEGSHYLDTVMTAENVLTWRDQEGRIRILHEDRFVGNGRCVTLRKALEGAEDEIDVPWPSYMTLIMKDATLPPMLRVEDTRLAASLFMSLATKPSAAENIPVDQIGKLKMIPGANPFIVHSMQTEAETVRRMLETTRCGTLVFNTGEFYVDEEGRIDIPKELTLSFYPKLARGEVEWEPFLPGLSMPRLGDEYDARYHPGRVKDRAGHRALLRARLVQRLAFLEKLGLDETFLGPLRKLVEAV